MNSLQIEKILSNYKPLKGIFKGVFASDTISLGMKFPFCFIANTMREGTSGQHWIACYSESRNTIDYFDSLADGAPIELQHFLDKFPQVNTNTISLQSLFSEACGQYCIYFLVKRRRHSFSNVLKTLYSLPINVREKMVKKFLHSLVTI
jgi:hypothetical protein